MTQLAPSSSDLLRMTTPQRLDRLLPVTSKGVGYLRQSILTAESFLHGAPGDFVGVSAIDLFQSLYFQDPKAVVLGHPEHTKFGQEILHQLFETTSDGTPQFKLVVLRIIIGYATKLPPNLAGDPKNLSRNISRFFGMLALYSRLSGNGAVVALLDGDFARATGCDPIPPKEPAAPPVESAAVIADTPSLFGAPPSEEPKLPLLRTPLQPPKVKVGK